MYSITVVRRVVPWCAAAGRPGAFQHALEEAALLGILPEDAGGAVHLVGKAAVPLSNGEGGEAGQSRELLGAQLDVHGGAQFDWKWCKNCGDSYCAACMCSDEISIMYFVSQSVIFKAS